MTRLRVGGIALGIALPLTITRAQDATLNGRVVHKTSKGGIPGAEVRLSLKNAQLITDSYALGQIITATTPGSGLVRSLTGTMAWIATARRPGVTLQPLGSSVDEYDRQRGADPKGCYPDVYVDGSVVYSFGRQNSLFDINSIATSAIAAVEFYVGPSQIPLQYNKTSAVCGVVLIWTK